LKTITLHFHLHAPPEEVYLALTNPFTLELWTGSKAEMSTESGSEFSLWEGDISGKNLEFKENEKIVQQWYFGEQEEPSIVTLEIQEGKEGTNINLLHTNVPDEDFEDIKYGWKNYYFGGLKAFFN